MKNLKSTAATTMAAIGSGLLLATVIAGPAAAETVAASDPVTATQTTTVSAKAKANVIGIDLAPNAIKVTNHGGKKVTVKGYNEKARSISPKTKNTPATFRKLTAGKTYTVSVDGKAIAKTKVLAAPGEVYNMVVQTVDADPGSVLMTWEYKENPKAGNIHFVLTATPIPGQSDQKVVQGEVPSTERAGLLNGLNPHTLYKFSVEAVNDAASGTNANAVMTRTLGDLTGADEAAQKAAEEAAAQAAADAAAKKAAEDAAAAAAQRNTGGGGSAAPSGPNTRTIWECPTGFSDNGGTCESVKAYTFHTETETKAYTYSQVQTGTRRNTDNEHCDYLPNPASPTGLDIYCTGGYDEPVYSTVKDAAPAGYSDNGSAWVKTVQVKDAAPAGYSDNGSAWVKTADKVSREVPA